MVQYSWDTLNSSMRCFSAAMLSLEGVRAEVRVTCSRMLQKRRREGRSDEEGGEEW